MSYRIALYPVMGYRASITPTYVTLSFDDDDEMHTIPCALVTCNFTLDINCFPI